LILEHRSLTSKVTYRATVPYLLQQGTPSSFTLCSGAQGDIGSRAAPAISQGALFSLATSAARELANTHVRFNEIYLAARVEVDSVATKNGTIKASQFGNVYEEILKRQDIKSARVIVMGKEDVETIRFHSKLKNL
jgi:NAD(P)-dependent dehydrogenase (short-subunit alcohol dehydrogenase family)